MSTFVARAARVLADRLVHRARTVWVAHRARVLRDPMYAAVTVLILSGVFGMVPVADVVAGVLSALLGVFTANRRRSHTGMDRWNDDWDMA